jgi:hypothetical protein
MIDIQGDENTTGKANGKAENVDKRKYLILHQIAPRNLQVITNHGCGLKLDIFNVGYMIVQASNIQHQRLL